MPPHKPEAEAEQKARWLTTRLVEGKQAEQKAQQLLKRLARLKTRWPSAPTLSNLSPQTVDALLKHLTARNENRELGNYFLAVISLLCVVGMGAAYYDLCVIMLVLFWFSYFLLSPFRKHNYRYAVYALTQTNDMRILSVLIQATREHWGRHSEVLCAIKRLLAAVTEEHAGLLNKGAQEALWYLSIPPLTLQADHDEELARLAVQVFTHIGNKDMLIRMQKFANHSAVYPAQQRICNLMKQLLPAMEARLQRQQAPETLLRAADVPTSQPEMLLRAALPASTEPPQQLLRASTAEERDTNEIHREEC